MCPSMEEGERSSESAGSLKAGPGRCPHVPGPLGVCPSVTCPLWAGGEVKGWWGTWAGLGMPHSGISMSKGGDRGKYNERSLLGAKVRISIPYSYSHPRGSSQMHAVWGGKSGSEHLLIPLSPTSQNRRAEVHT